MFAGMVALYRVAYTKGRYALSAYFYERERADAFVRTHRRSTVVEELHSEDSALRLAGAPPRRVSTALRPVRVRR